MFLSSTSTRVLNISRNGGSTISLDIPTLLVKRFSCVWFLFRCCCCCCCSIQEPTTQLTNPLKKHTQSPLLIAVQQNKGTTLNIVPCKFLLTGDFCRRIRENWSHKHKELHEHYHSLSAHRNFNFLKVLTSYVRGKGHMYRETCTSKNHICWKVLFSFYKKWVFQFLYSIFLIVCLN